MKSLLLGPAHRRNFGLGPQRGVFLCLNLGLGPCKGVRAQGREEGGLKTHEMSQKQVRIRVQAVLRWSATGISC
jgi:hypothetical protein